MPDEPRIPECVDPLGPMNLGQPVLEVGCEPGEPPSDGAWKCLMPFPRRITIQWTTGGSLNGFFPLGRTPETHSPMNPPFVHLISNTDTSFELTGQDPAPTMSFVLNDLVAAAYYDLIASGAWSVGANQMHLRILSAMLYTQEALVTGKTLTLISQKTDESWWDGQVGAGYGGGGGSNCGPLTLDPFTPILGVRGCQQVLPFTSIYKHFMVGSVVANCQPSTVTCVQHPTAPGPILSFSGSVASGFVALSLPGNNKAARMSRLGDPRHLAFVGFLPCDVPQDETVLFQERLSYIGGSALANSVGWPAYGNLHWSADIIDCAGNVVNGPASATNGFTSGFSGFPDVSPPVTTQFSYSNP